MVILEFDASERRLAKAMLGGQLAVGGVPQQLVIALGLGSTYVKSADVYFAIHWIHRQPLGIAHTLRQLCEKLHLPVQ